MINTCVARVGQGLDLFESYFWLVIVLMFFVVALLYMIGRLLRRTDFEAMAKTELREVLISVAMGFGVFAFALVLCSGASIMMSEYAPDEFSDQFSYAEIYIKELIALGKEMFVNLWSLSITLSSMKFEAPIGKIPYIGNVAKTINPFGILPVLGNAIGIVSGLIISPFVGSLHAQLILLQISEAFALTIILPIGMILRAIPITRDGGAFMIALAFGLYIIFPFMYVIDYDISKRVAWPGLGELTSEEILDPKKTTFPELIEVINRIFTPFSKAAKMIPQATIIAVLNFTITIAFISIFSTFLQRFE